LRAWIEEECKSAYLGGPNGTDFLFPNQIRQEREGLLYVDYVWDDSDSEDSGVGQWTAPHNFPQVWYSTPPAISLAVALQKSGLVAKEGLSAVSEIWRPIKPQPSMTQQELHQINERTIKAVAHLAEIGETTTDAIRLVIDSWPYPLWQLDLRPLDRNSKERKERKKHLRDIRRQSQYDEGSF
jgi:hypothetical protein